MRIDEFKKEYPEITLSSFEDIEGMSNEEIKKYFGVSESEFTDLWESYLRSAHLNDVEDDYEYCGPLTNELPKKLFMVRLLGVSSAVPRGAYKRFASLYPERFACGEFWLPSADKIYRSYSGAKARADLLSFNGVECEVVECSPSWVVRETQGEKLARLERENAELRAKLLERAA